VIDVNVGDNPDVVEVRLPEESSARREELATFMAETFTYPWLVPPAPPTMYTVSPSIETMDVPTTSIVGAVSSIELPLVTLCPSDATTTLFASTEAGSMTTLPSFLLTYSNTLLAKSTEPLIINIPVLGGSISQYPT
jgi:hypothetical protein